MTSSQLSSLISIGVAISILMASFLQWWDITYNGKMQTRLWVKIFFGVCIVAFIISGYLLFRA